MAADREVERQQLQYYRHQCQWVVAEAGREVLGVEQVDQGVAESRSLVRAEQMPAEAEEASQIQDAEVVVVEE